MTSINVLVIFTSRSGRTEKLALAAAVGAVQARANIRIRRLVEGHSEGGSPSEALARMQREYVSPAAADVVWADAVIIGLDGKLAGTPIDPAGATAYGRHVATTVRAAKSAL